AIRRAYAEDVFFKKIVEHPTEYRGFSLQDGLIYSRNHGNEEVVCILNREKSVRGMLIEQAHETLRHYGGQRTSDYLRQWYWW
ncbi:hypothetical protein K438DRAFT_1493340, partial [Mycena galopus ATCC 62051]